jgi:hypothetical protein
MKMGCGFEPLTRMKKTNQYACTQSRMLVDKHCESRSIRLTLPDLRIGQVKIVVIACTHLLTEAGIRVYVGISQEM